jgi:hypothetical protein
VQAILDGERMQVEELLQLGERLLVGMKDVDPKGVPDGARGGDLG